jgi:hypothetical protein
MRVSVLVASVRSSAMKRVIQRNPKSAALSASRIPGRVMLGNTLELAPPQDRECVRPVTDRTTNVVDQTLLHEPLPPLGRRHAHIVPKSSIPNTIDHTPGTLAIEPSQRSHPRQLLHRLAGQDFDGHRLPPDSRSFPSFNAVEMIVSNHPRAGSLAVHAAPPPPHRLEPPNMTLGVRLSRARIVP